LDQKDVQRGRAAAPFCGLQEHAVRAVVCVVVTMAVDVGLLLLLLLFFVVCWLLFVHVGVVVGCLE